MKLEQVLPALRDGQVITRTKIYNNGQSVWFFKIENNRLKFHVLFPNGDGVNWAYYALKTDDIFADNWEVAG